MRVHQLGLPGEETFGQQTRMWPTPQDYNEAIQNPKHCFSDSDLCQGRVETNAIGLPKAASGSFASVYKVVTPSGSWAVRCFLTSRMDQAERYKHVSEFVMFDELDCTVDFQYMENGIKVGGQWYPIVKMPWIEGPTLDLYVRQNLKNKAKLLEVKNDFYALSMALENAGIAHGDLQHGNIIVSPDGLRLVDYDAFFVPALLGRLNLEYGHPNYQHPLRDDYHFDVSVDNFSSWLIHCSLIALCVDPELFDILGGGDDSILFKRADLASPETSKVFAALSSHESKELRDISNLLSRMLWLPPHTVPPLNATPEQLSTLPAEKAESWNHQTSAQLDALEEMSARTLAAPSSEKAKVKRPVGRRTKAVGQKVSKVAGTVLNSVLEFTTPGLLASLRTHQAGWFMEEGSYEKAHAAYLKVRALQQSSFPLERNREISILLKLACCSLYLNSTNQSDNYCMVAAQLASTYGKQFVTAEKKDLAQFYEVLAEVLFSIARKTNDGKAGVISTLTKLLDESKNIVSSPEKQYVVSCVMDLILALLAHSLLPTDKEALRHCTSSLFTYSIAWAKFNCTYEYLPNYSRKAQHALALALTGELDDPKLTLQAQIVSRAFPSYMEADFAFIDNCMEDSNLFKQAMQEAIRDWTFKVAMDCITPSLAGLYKGRPHLFPNTVVWLWREVVFDVKDEKMSVVQRLNWLREFNAATISICLDEESVKYIVKKMQAEFTGKDRFWTLEEKLLALSRLGKPGRTIVEKLLQEMIWILRGEEENLNKSEIESAQRLISEFAALNSVTWRYVDNFHDSGPRGPVNRA